MSSIAASRRWTSDVIQPSSLSSGPAAAIIKEFHTTQTTTHCITDANIAPITFVKVPLRSRCAALHTRGSLDTIGDCTCPHVPIKGSVPLITPSTRHCTSGFSLTRFHELQLQVTCRHTLSHASTCFNHSRWCHCWRQPSLRCCWRHLLASTADVIFWLWGFDSWLFRFDR